MRVCNRARAFCSHSAIIQAAPTANGPIRMRLVKPCTRCQITTTDQTTGERASEPLATLATYRMNAALEGVTFGVNAIVTAGVGEELRVGAAADCSLRF